MKSIKRIAALGCALTMAIGVCGVNVSAADWHLQKPQGAPTSEYKYEDEISFKASRNGFVYGRCNNYSLTTGAVSALLLFPYNGNIYQINGNQITGTGNCNIYDENIYNNLKCTVQLWLTHPSSTMGNASGVYK